MSVWQQTRHLQEFQTFSSNWSDWNKLELENPGDRANKGFEDTHDFELLSSRLYLNPASVSFAWILTCKQFLKFTVLKGKIISGMQIKTREILVWKLRESSK